MKLTSATEVKRFARSVVSGSLEEQFHQAWKLTYPGLPQPLRQHRFHPERKWLFDFAWPEWKVAVEIQGGSFVRGGHNRAGQQAKDYEKQREAVKLGWRVLPFNTIDLKDVFAVVDCVAEVLTNAKVITRVEGAK